MYNLPPVTDAQEWWFYVFHGIRTFFGFYI